MNFRTATGVVLLVTAGASGLSPAMIMRHDVDEAEYRSLAEGYPQVCEVPPGGEGTLVGKRWILTAAHVAQGVRMEGGVVRCGGVEYSVGKVYLHPDWNRKHADIALLKLQGPVAGIRPAELNRKRNEVGKLVTFVGRGDPGTGKTGPRAGDGVLRAATNRVEDVTDHWIVFIFDPPGRATRLEGISGPGDSGGPAFHRRGDHLTILGVSSRGMEPPGVGRGQYGSKEFYSRVSSYIDWLDEVMGEDARARR